LPIPAKGIGLVGVIHELPLPLMFPSPEMGMILESQLSRNLTLSRKMSCMFPSLLKGMTIGLIVYFLYPNFLSNPSPNVVMLRIGKRRGALHAP